MHQWRTVLLKEEDLERSSLPEMVAAVERALRALGRGEIINPPRREQLGRIGDPNYFRMEFDATWHGPHHEVLWRCRKVIEEMGGGDDVAHALGKRVAWIELEDTARKARIRLDAGMITDMRTAIAALLGIRFLVRPCPRVLAVVGTGRVGRAVVRCAPYVLPVRAIRVTSRRKARREHFVAAHAPMLGVPLTACAHIEECLAGADAAIVAIPARKPVLEEQTAAHLRHISLVAGDPRTVMAERCLWERRWCVADHMAQATRTGDLIHARREGWFHRIRWAKLEGRPATLADAAMGRLAHLAGEPIMLLLTGMATLDLAVARHIWERALNAHS